jgi:hypothetical protein
MNNDGYDTKYLSPAAVSKRQIAIAAHCPLPTALCPLPSAVRLLPTALKLP